MKKLFVLRHAKSSWDHPNLSDFERPLNKRGKRVAPLMGELILEKNWLPETIVSSTAKRAKQTAALVKASAEIGTEIQFDRRIYEASTNSLLHIVGETADNFSSIMIVGHNPGFEGLVEILTGNYQRMPTAALAIIKLELESWQNVAPACGKLFEVLRPKEQFDRG